MLLGLCAGPSVAATFTGTVFEDVNYGGGAGRARAAATGSVVLANVRVELYRVSTGALVDSDTTTASGTFSLQSSGNASVQAEAYIVRVVNGSVRSSRGTSCTTCVAVQTFRTDATTGTPVAVSNRVGGETPALSDAAQLSSGNISSLTTSTTVPQSITTADPAASSSTISGLDFGFNFDTVVNTRDASTCTPSGSNSTYFPCQGSLRQFILNANALGGESSLAQSGSGQLDGLTTSLPGRAESSIFMIPSAALSSGIALITLAADLPTLTGASTRLDATTQTVNIGNTNAGTLGTGSTVGVDNNSLPLLQRPEVELVSGNRVITLGSSSQSINGFALRQGYILLSGTSCIARNNLVGMTASGVSTADSSTTYGITFAGANAIVRNNYVKVNNSGIRGDSPGSGAVISYNEVARPDGGHTNTFDGIVVVNSANDILIENNLTRDQAGGGIELGFGGGSLSNITVQNNTVSNNGYTSGTTPSTEPLGLVGYLYSGTNILLYRNRIVGTAGPGLLITQANGTRASQNVFSNNGSISIDLDPRTNDPNSLGGAQGVTLNDSGDGDTGPNGLLNYPVLVSANIVGSELYLRGFARPGAYIEVYVAQPDPTSFGEGLTYVTALTEGSAADLDATTGTYGAAAVNGLAQGTDTTNRFFFRIAVPTGVSVGTTLTATATVSAQTSEFGGNLVVSGAPTLTHQKTVEVLSDPLNGTTEPKSIPGALERYTVRLTNTGPATVDTNTLSIVDAVPTNTALYVLDLGSSGSGPVAFVNGSPASGVTWTYSGLNSTTDSLEFSNDGGTTWTYVPAANANGCDPAVTHIRARPAGSMAASSEAGNPWFELRFQVRVN